MLEERMRYGKTFPEGTHALLNLGKVIKESGLEASLLELVKTRASQLNGCAYCIDMHTKDARAAGETEQRLYALSAWRETPFFTGRERAALAWTEAITNIQQGHASDEVYAEARAAFDLRDCADQHVEPDSDCIARGGWQVPTCYACGGLGRCVSVPQGAV